MSLRRHLLGQDLIYVGGGSLVNLLALWHAHGLDEVMREAWRSGVDGPGEPLDELRELRLRRSREQRAGRRGARG